MRRRLAIVIGIALLSGLYTAGCGDDGGTGAPGGGPGAGKNTVAVPPGAPYDLNGRQWGKLSQADQFLAATAFATDNPDRCGDADVGDLSIYVTNSYANDAAPSVAAAQILAAGCDAAR